MHTAEYSNFLPCATICNGFVSSGVDLILANATGALQAAAAATKDIPILGTAVTEYGLSLIHISSLSMILLPEKRLSESSREIY